MKKISAFFMLSLSIISCSLNTDSPSVSCGNTKNVAFKTYSYCNTLIAETTTSKAIVVDTQQKFDAYFQPCVPPVDDATKKKIDFGTTMLIGVFSGVKPTGGYGIKIQSVVESDCEVVVGFYESVPQPDENVTQATTYPKELITIPKTTKPIYFQRVTQNTDYVVLGSFAGECIGSECQQFYGIDSQKVLRYSNVGYGNYEMRLYDAQALVYNEDFADFSRNIPREIINLKGQTKTYGAPDSHDQGGIYVALYQGTMVAKVYLDNDNTADQNAAMLVFKKIHSG
ncbi:protease complex subunit PrcB family protein [Flavobacterium restrictum]|uniref:Protease complex subunit PrcB family protein n=1 Tax=Flavobacterium restrictum TaxID=2594428 RepID=A0A553E304_9FLAO|nr:protease complex subunit PrcB family protein [Flavobacterium restrictum]TRX39253.1 protease complex subunit PrcB family protein [Flavobacterium restrictum]